MPEAWPVCIFFNRLSKYGFRLPITFLRLFRFYAEEPNFSRLSLNSPPRRRSASFIDTCCPPTGFFEVLFNDDPGGDATRFRLESPRRGAGHSGVPPPPPPAPATVLRGSRRIASTSSYRIMALQLRSERLC